MRLASLSRLLTATCAVALLGACNGSSTTPGGDGTPNQNPNTNTPKSPPPQALQGNWLNGTISPLWFWDENSQMVQNGGGTAAYFVFKPDGSYEEFLYASFSSSSCRYLSWSSTEGTATFEEGTFHIYPTKGRSKYTDCTHGSDFDKPLDAEELKKAQKVYHWKFQAQADGTTKLMMGPNETSLSIFQKAQ